jgi:hypothetical protein
VAAPDGALGLLDGGLLAVRARGARERGAATGAERAKGFGWGLRSLAGTGVGGGACGKSEEKRSLQRTLQK